MEAEVGGVNGVMFVLFAYVCARIAVASAVSGHTVFAESLSGQNRPPMRNYVAAAVASGGQPGKHNHMHVGNFILVLLQRNGTAAFRMHNDFARPGVWHLAKRRARRRRQ